MGKKATPLLMGASARAVVAVARSPGMLLGPEELRELTGKSRGDAQCRVLARMGIAHKRRPDGTLAVLRSQAEAALGGAPGGGGTIPAPSREPELEL